jgi:hypothetical protein
MKAFYFVNITIVLVFGTAPGFPNFQTKYFLVPHGTACFQTVEIGLWFDSAAAIEGVGGDGDLLIIIFHEWKSCVSTAFKISIIVLSVIVFFSYKAAADGFDECVFLGLVAEIFVLCFVQLYCKLAFCFTEQDDCEPGSCRAQSVSGRSVYCLL